MKARTILLIIFSCIALVGVALFLGWKSLRPFNVPTGAMDPTIPPGTLVFVDEFAYRSPDQVKRGDVIIFDITQDWMGGQPSVYVFRVMGIPGDDFKVDAIGKVTIDGEPIKERQRGETHSEFQGIWYDIFPMGGPASIPLNRFPKKGIIAGKIPEGNFFVMGDNRGNALDSRYWGFVPWEDVRGKVRLDD